MATVVTTPPPPSSSSSSSASAAASSGLNLESLTHIDITKLSQSELYALSNCSSSAFDLPPCDDVVMPDIHRSLLTESSGSRRQTYSRPCHNRHHRHHLHPRSRLPGHLSGSELHPSLDPENHAILHYLKHYLKHNSTNDCPPPPPPPPLPPSPPPQPSDLQQQLSLGMQETMPIAVHEVENKRKRGQKPKWNLSLLENVLGIEPEGVNKNGEKVDFIALETNGDELYDAELRRRTAGLETEEAVLEFLRGLEGQWCSRRKKRKYVDACQFGDALPIGWKLLLALRRRDSRVLVYCARIISPTGEQLLSCKEASLFLRSYFEGKGINQQVDLENCIVEQAGAVASGSTSGFVDNADHTSHEIGSTSSLACLTASDAHENEVCLMDIDNLADVQVQNLIECDKCNISFDHKNSYLQHVMFFHQQTTKRYKLGDSVVDGVIIKDGKFECQFCHKVFLERRSYNSHVGVHVRNHAKGSEGLPTPDSVQKNRESPSQEELCPRTCKENALIETAQNSDLASSSGGLTCAAVNIVCPGVVDLYGTLASSTNHGATSISDRTQQGSECMMGDGRMVKSNDRQTFEINPTEICTDDAEQSDAKEVKEQENNNIEIGFGHWSPSQSDDVANSEARVGEENVLQDGINSSLVPLVQSFDYFSSVSDKGEDEFFLASQKLENLPGFEELELDDMGTFKLDFADGQESSSLPEVSVDLASDMGKEGGLNASVGFDLNPVQLNTSGPHQFTTVCVWCRSEFKVEAFDSELQSDSIGYMCTVCKDNVSGHFDRIYC